MEKKKVITWSIIGVVSVLLITLGISYAFWIFNATQTNKNVISSQCFKLSFQENTNSNISLLEGYPMSDEDGKVLTPYTFSVQNNCNAKAKYTVRLEIDHETTMNMQYIKSLLNTNAIKKLNELPETSSTLSNVSKSLVLEEMTINANETKNYELRLWIDGGVTADNKEVMNKILKSKVTIEGNYDSNYTETILNGTDPVIKDNLIPVTISNDGTVKKADTTKEWYSYEKKNWANAIILEDETKTYQNGETIPESNIESYFVWIPRYKYQIFDNGLYSGLTTEAYQEKSQEIKVVFESKKAVATKGTKKGDWLTHPAFTSFDSNGMWVGKYETGFKGATTTSEAQANVNDISKVQIKPNVYSWRSIQVSNAHLNSYNYQRNLDSHMMKNTEWGAVAYLQHSKYGSMASVRINNNSSYLTGYAAVNEPTCGDTGTNEACNKFEGTTMNADGTYTKRYNSENGYLASTTGNISGIYDMSGGAQEYVMGVMADKNGKPASGATLANNGGFNGPTTDDNQNVTNKMDFPDLKYYDLYAYSETDQSYNRRIFGDAIGEMGPASLINYNSNYYVVSSWYKDGFIFLINSYPWLRRSGSFVDGNKAGTFYSFRDNGDTDGRSTYRIVMAF